MDIGARLKKAREAAGFTQPVAAGQSGIGVSTISEFENSKRKPSFSQLSKLAEVYRKTIEFFLTDEPVIENVMLWRDEPEDEESSKQIESQFRQLCEQYHRLELCTNEIKQVKLPESDVTKPEEFGYPQVKSFARHVQKSFSLGDVPIVSLKRILEEAYHIKIFYLEFAGSAISTVSEQFGPAILLNTKNKQWRRSYDLAHELFHILTWKVFRPENSDSPVVSENEERLANAFASVLLMPQEALEEKIRVATDQEGQISLDELDNIARGYDVSLDALICRMANIFKFKKEQTEKSRDIARNYMKFLKPRLSHKPDILPERYCDLAQRALREGKLSLIQFAKYMGISYRKAQEYVTEDEGFGDEKISISVA